MTDTPQSESPAPADQPGKTRTWWHPLFARMLDFVLASGYTVQEEVVVGKMPLRVDILLVRREGGEVSAARRQELSALLPLLNRFTLIEFKGPTDSLERGDFAQLTGCAFLWHSQQNEAIPREDMTLIVLAPNLTGPFREELRLLGCDAQVHEPGIFSVVGLPFTTWLVETDVMAELGQFVLCLVSRVFLTNRERIIDKLLLGVDDILVWYAIQQIQQFQSEKGFAMQHALSENMEEVKDVLIAKVLKKTAAEQRVRGLPAEERLRGLSPKEVAAALSDEDAAQLREILEKKKDGKK